LSVAAASAVVLLAVSGCTNNATTSSTTTAATASAAAPTTAPSAAPSSAASTAASAAPSAAGGPNAAAVALLPAAVRDSGTLVVGTNLTYAPDEFKDPQGAPTGWGVDLVQAIAQRLGLTADLRDAQFDNIIPGVKGGKYNVGWASFTDTVERQQSVDFVDYYNAGIQWASQAGKTVVPDDACGLTIAVGTGTYQETDELPAKSKACVDAGKEPLNLLKLDTQGDITNAVVLGRADAMSADSPVTQYAVSQTGGKLQLAGEIFDAAPFGVALSKDGGMTPAVQAALQSMIDDGTYAAILKKWGVEAGAVTTAAINGGTS
jgi:polar amino acid transport system substrate-binding protein